MNLYSQSLTLPNTAYRRLLLVSAGVTFLHILAGSSILLHMVTGVLIAVSGAFAWFYRDTPPWVRIPPMVGLWLLALHLVVSTIVVRMDLPLLAELAHPSLAALMWACLLIPAVALTVPDERSQQRIGGRAMQRWRRFVRMLAAAALLSWVLLPLSAETVATASTGQSFYLGTLLLTTLLTVLALWYIWRTRRDDWLMLSLAGLAGSIVLAQSSIEVGRALLAMPPVPAGLHLPPTTVLWGTLIVLTMLALRRPIPTVAEHAPTSEAKQPSLLADYISLTKPKVISLLLVTTLGAMFITGEGMPSLALVLWTMLGGYLAAGGAGAINCAFDKNIDVNMGRTSKRPVPSGRIAPRNAFLFGAALSVLAFVVLVSFTTLLAAVLAMVGVVYYAFFYTRWLKPNTWQNIVIGGAAGSLPPLVGWSAVTGTLTLPAVILFMIIFYWTPPHFWALALIKEKDYARAGVPMLPVVAGEHETRWQIWLYSLLLVALTAILTPIGAMGPLYLVLAAVLGGIFLRYAWQVWRTGGQTHIWGLYKYSLLYLALLFAAMVLDRVLLA